MAEANPLWHQRALVQQIDGRAFINGQRVWARSEQQFDNFSPIDGRKLGSIARCDTQDIDLAVAAARAAFDDGRWSRMAPARRKKVLIRFADLIQKNIAELALLETLDMGKPIKYSQSVMYQLPPIACAGMARRSIKSTMKSRRRRPIRWP